MALSAVRLKNHRTSDLEELMSTIASQRERIQALELENTRLRAQLMVRNQAMSAENLHLPRPRASWLADRPDTPPPPATPPPATPPIETRPHRQRRDSLWIVHDNSTLASHVADLVGRGKAAEILLETMQSSRDARLVLGRVVFAGPVDATAAAGAVKAGSRGALCFHLAPCFAIKIDLGQRRQVAGFGCVSLRGAQHLRSVESATTFFSDCDGRVDAVLQPQRLNDAGRRLAPSDTGAEVALDAAPWLPYWDADQPPRKLAPQFRSNGVGYVRLGDDMSRHGLAFVSADGASFLDDSASVDPSSLAVQPSTTPKSTGRLRPRAENRRLAASDPVLSSRLRRPTDPSMGHQPR